MLEREIDWLVQKLTEEYPNLETMTIQDHPDWTTRDFLRARIVWGIPKGFVYFWGDELGPYGGILIRPVNDELITQGTFDYWRHFWDFDPKGDICWVDYAWGPGLYSKMLVLCRSTGCPRIGWRHRDRMHVRPMERMPHKTMKLAFHI